MAAISYQTPGVYIEEVSGGARPIQAVGTRTAGFVGVAPDPTAEVNSAVPINNWSQFRQRFFPKDGDGNVKRDAAWTDLAHGVYGFFQNGGSRCYVVNVGEGNVISGGGGEPAGLDLLTRVDEIAIVAAPGYTDAASYDALQTHCERLKDRVAILDGPRLDGPIQQAEQTLGALAGGGGKKGDWQRPAESAKGFTTLYVPWLRVRNPLPAQNGGDQLVTVPPSGHIAGVWARSDATRGVHKAPANEVVNGALDLTYQITHEEQGNLNPNGVNCIRYFVNEGIKVWGARTLAKSDPEWRYLNVRRLFNMIEESILTSTRWIVFEPNDRPLWQAIRRDVSAFLMGFWRDGALMGRTAEEAFYVKCDEETNPIESINEGRVVIEIGIAPVKPAEFVIFRISQYQAGASSETA
ncbi:MAG: phage tail sheath subtilisin-like domain-containing protein [Caldilineaceae bacterium]